MLFEVRAIADPQSLPRILGHFSQAWLTPRRVAAELDGDTLICRCVVDMPDRISAQQIAAKLASSVLVIGVDMREISPA